MSRMNESDLEKLFLEILSNIGYSIAFGPDLSPGGKYQEREYSESILTERLREHLRMINPEFPEDAIEDAIRRVRKNQNQDLINNNHDFHELLVNGVDVEYKKNDSIRHGKVFLFDFNHVDNNEFLVLVRFKISFEFKRISLNNG